MNAKATTVLLCFVMGANAIDRNVPLVRQFPGINSKQPFDEAASVAGLPITSSPDKMTNKIDDDALLNALNEIDTEQSPKPDQLGYIDTVLGQGTQSRIVESVSTWVTNKAKANPDCVERFVCETYKTGETLEGFPYLLMQMTNAAVSFFVAELFDDAIDIHGITKAARFGRNIGSCHAMECPVIDGQLRNISDILGSLEDIFSSIFDSVSNSIGKRR